MKLKLESHCKWCFEKGMFLKRKNKSFFCLYFNMMKSNKNSKYYFLLMPRGYGKKEFLNSYFGKKVEAIMKGKSLWQGKN